MIVAPRAVGLLYIVCSPSSLASIVFVPSSLSYVFISTTFNSSLKRDCTDSTSKFSIFFGKVTLKHGFTYIISSALSFSNTTLTTIFSFVVTVDHLSLYIAIPIF